MRRRDRPPPCRGGGSGRPSSASSRGARRTLPSSRSSNPSTFFCMQSSSRGLHSGRRTAPTGRRFIDSPRVDVPASAPRRRQVPARGAARGSAAALLVLRHRARTPLRAGRRDLVPAQRTVAEGDRQGRRRADGARGAVRLEPSRGEVRAELRPPTIRQVPRMTRANRRQPTAGVTALRVRGAHGAASAERARGPARRGAPATAAGAGR